MSGTTAPQPDPIAPVQHSFIVNVDGTRTFYPSGFQQAPAGAEPCTYVQRLIAETLNPNVVWMSWDGLPSQFVSPQPVISTEAFEALLTPAEFDASTDATQTTPALFRGLVKVLANGADLSSALTQGMFALMVSAGTIDPSRVPYVMAGLPPDASAPLPPSVKQAAGSSSANTATAGSGSIDTVGAGSTTTSNAPTASASNAG